MVEYRGNGMAYVFGPVPSRRLGRSLGVDLVPFKTCTYDCIYCQLGRTTHKTTDRREWVALDEVLAELAGKLPTNPDYITLSGSGEPTLYSRLDELIAAVREMTSIPVAVLTNGSLLWQPEVRRQLAGAQLVIPSLDAGDAAMFGAVNRPDPRISFERMLDGLIAFREEFAGQYWLEVFLLAGYNALPAEVAKIARCARRIRPDRIQLNTVTRPPAEDYAMTVSAARLDELAKMFEPPAEVIADYRGVHAERDFAATRETVLQMLRRRPCTVTDIAEGLGIHRNEAIKYVEALLAAGAIERTTSAGKSYFRATPAGPQAR